MSISTTNNRNDYVGAGTLAAYSYTFRILAEEDLQVVVEDLSGTRTTLTLGTDYTVSGVGLTAGGSVTLVDADQDWLTSSGFLVTGYLLVIRRVRELKQLSDFRNQGDFFPETHEDAFDHCIMVDQQQQDEIDRSLKAPETETTSIGPLPSVEDRASKFAAYDADGDPIASDGGISSSIPVSSYAETLLDDTSASAAQTTLGISTFVKTILDDADAATVRTTIGAGVLTNTASKTTTYSSTNADQFIPCNATSGAFQVNLYTAVGNEGKVVRIKKTDSSFNAVTIEGNSTETIDDSLNTTLNTQYETLTLLSDGANWHILDRRIPATLVSYTPTITGCGTVTVNQMTWHRIGPMICLSGRITSGTVTSGDITVTLPTGLSADYSGSAVVGGGMGADYASGGQAMIAPVILGSALTVVQFGTSNSQSVFTALHGDQVLGTGGAWSFTAFLKIANWKG
jgi:hypothetical protein